MIDISSRLSHEKKEHHFTGFIGHLNHILLKSQERYKIKFGYNIEEKFYRELLLNRDFAKDIILFSKPELLSFEESYFYKKHRLFFLLCLDQSTRNKYPFNIHFMKEFKNLPYDVSRDIATNSVSYVSEKIRERCKKVFNYSKFSRVDRSKTGDRSLWNGYNYLSGFMPKTCPYCNLDLITLLEDCLDDEGVNYILRPAIDHFLAKSLFPFFSLSINNLVPSCTNCNSSFKGELNFKLIEHISPMGNSFRNKASFIIELKSQDNVYSAIDDIYNLAEFNVDNFKVSIESTDPVSIKNLETFRLNERYNNHKEGFEIFLKKLPKATVTKINEYKDWMELDSFNEALELFLDYHVDERKHCDIPFSILKRDLIQKYFTQ
ncbi:hypothetical protein [Photobacterium swingsii]|uniref:hypothetical protein n=1 Tax=Photobacterium swingsii TaxID=680026 RepID=UPI004068DB5F